MAWAQIRTDTPRRYTLSCIAVFASNPNHRITLPAGGAFRRMPRKVHQFSSLICLCFVAIAACLIPNLSAQNQPSRFINNDQSAASLVRQVVHNEIEAQLRDTSLWCYLEHRQEDGKPPKTLQICQTKDGDLDRLTALNGIALTPAQRQAEDQRLQQIVAHPEQLRAKQKKSGEDGEQQRNLFKSFPDAFLFQCESESGSLVTLHFRPNPAFRPATRAAMVFHHLEGTLVVDASQQRLVEINGRITSEVKFAGGLLGHLDKGGTFFVQQREVRDAHWDLTHLTVHMSGKVLFFKTICINETQTLAAYQPLPGGATLQQAADFLSRDFEVHTASSSGN